MQDQLPEDSPTHGRSRRGSSPRAAHDRLVPVIDDFAKEYLHNDLREIRETVRPRPDGRTPARKAVNQVAGWRW
jgi:hypothetical protein